jgi:hypothetical protein
MDAQPLERAGAAVTQTSSPRSFVRVARKMSAKAARKSSVSQPERLTSSKVKASA